MGIIDTRRTAGPTTAAIQNARASRQVTLITRGATHGHTSVGAPLVEANFLHTTLHRLFHTLINVITGTLVTVEPVPGGTQTNIAAIGVVALVLASVTQLTFINV